MATTADLPTPVARALDAFNDQDIEGWLAAFTEDATFTDPIEPDGLSKDELREYTVAVFEGFPDVRAEHHRVIKGDDDTLAVEWTIHGTHEGPFDDIPPTGETVALPGVSIITVSEEGITSWRDYFDQQLFAEQLGLSPE